MKITKKQPEIIPSQASEVGFVCATRNYLIILNGLPTVKINEIVVSDQEIRGLVTSLGDNAVEVLLLDDAIIHPNERFVKTGKQLTIDVGDKLLGRAINPLGIPVDGKGKLGTLDKSLPIYRVATGIKSRQFIKTPFETGITTVDMLVPVAKGQRELMIGPARSGKSGFILDTIVNQKRSKNAVVVLGLIGKPLTEIKRTIDILAVNKALEYTVIIASSSSDPASLIYISPSVSMSIAEYFQSKGKDVLVVLDDLGLHAKYTREIYLLGNRAPGRESYPGDIFSIHAALLERAGNFRPEYGGGSITALPTIETSFNDYQAFIPTNLMAMTDGHILFDYDLYHRGLRPAVNIGLSVSRVGRQTQSIVAKVLADRVKSVIAQAKKYETLSRFGSEVAQTTQQILNQSKQIEIMLSQSGLVNIPRPVQIILLGLIFTQFLLSKDDQFLKNNKKKIIEYLEKKDLNALDSQISQMKTEDELFKLLVAMSPELEKICLP